MFTFAAMVHSMCVHRSTACSRVSSDSYASWEPLVVPAVRVVCCVCVGCVGCAVRLLREQILYRSCEAAWSEETIRHVMSTCAWRAERCEADRIGSFVLRQLKGAFVGTGNLVELVLSSQVEGDSCHKCILIAARHECLCGQAERCGAGRNGSSLSGAYSAQIAPRTHLPGHVSQGCRDFCRCSGLRAGERCSAVLCCGAREVWEGAGACCSSFASQGTGVPRPLAPRPRAAAAALTIPPPFRFFPFLPWFEMDPEGAWVAHHLFSHLLFDHLCSLEVARLVF